MLNLFEHGLRFGSYTLANGFEVSGLLIGLFFGMSFYVSVSMVREKPMSQAKVVDFHFLEAMTETFRNPSFPSYVTASAAIRMSVDIMLAAMPFMVAKLMGLEEGLAGYLQGVIVIGAAFMFPLVSRLGEKHGKKKIFKLGLLWFAGCLVLLALMRHFPFLGWPAAGVAKLLGKELPFAWISFAHCMVTLALCAFSISIVFVLQRPVLSDVIDLDEKLTGFRREAMYNGMEGLISKPASGIAYFIVPLLNGFLGASADRPMGIITAPIVAAVVLLVGWWVFRGYPIEK
jgi:GPH family glycoside/pentoside/hexuronide:cation symporter